MKTTDRKAAFYVVRPNHFGGWVTESPRGFFTQHSTKEKAEAYARRRANKIEYRIASDHDTTTAATDRPGDQAAALAEEWSVSYSDALVYCNCD